MSVACFALVLGRVSFPPSSLAFLSTRWAACLAPQLWPQNPKAFICANSKIQPQSPLLPLSSSYLQVPSPLSVCPLISTPLFSRFGFRVVLPSPNPKYKRRTSCLACTRGVTVSNQRSQSCSCPSAPIICILPCSPLLFTLHTDSHCAAGTICIYNSLLPVQKKECIFPPLQTIRGSSGKFKAAWRPVQ